MSNSLDYLDDLGLDTESFSIVTVAEEFTLSGRQMTLQKGKKIPFLATINGKSFEATALMHSAALTRITRQSHLTRDMRPSSIVSGVIRPMQLEIDIELGDKTIPLATLLFDLVNHQLTKDKAEPVSYAQFVKTIHRMGMPLVADPNSGLDANMSCFFQHFGPDDEVVAEILGLLTKLGGKNVRNPDSERITDAIELPGKGIDVLAMEIGRTDRSASGHAGREIKLDDGSFDKIEGIGFIDFVDATIGNFTRGVSQRKIRSILKAQRESLVATGKAKADEIAVLNSQIDVATKLSRNWMNNLAGAQRRIATTPDGRGIYEAIVDATNAPCGRLVLDIEGAETEYNFWQNQNVSTTTTRTESVVDTTGGALGAEEPF